jgi:hypothetical protein
MLVENRCLERLDLGGSDIDCHGANELAQAIMSSSSLQTLVLCVGTLPTQQLKGFMTVPLNVLDLSHQRLQPQDGMVISRCLHGNTSLLSLDLVCERVCSVFRGISR